MDNTEYICCGRKMDLIGITETGNFKYSCEICYAVIEIDEQLENARVIHKGENKNVSTH